MDKLRKEFEKAEEIQKIADEKDPFDGFLDPKTTHFKYEEIKGIWPDKIKPDAKEWYLVDEEFEKVMGMTKEAYGALKKWKQGDMRKKVGLF